MTKRRATHVLLAGLIGLLVARSIVVDAPSAATHCPATNGLGHRAAPHLAKGAEPTFRLGTPIPAPNDPTCTPFDHLAIAVRQAYTDRSALIVLGEVHDNPAHHVLRALLIDHVASHRGTVAPPTIVFEHLGPEQFDRIQRYNTDLRENPAEAVASFLKGDWWNGRGWPSDREFAPLFDVIQRHKLPLKAGNIAPNRARAIARGGVSAIAQDERSGWGLDLPLWTQREQNDLLNELVASHCGLLPQEAFSGLALAQRARDGAMARALLDSAQHAGAILLTGNGHARSDRGVPLVVRGMDPARTIIAIGFVEEGAQDPTITVQPYEGVVVTPRHPRPDPCEAMRKAVQERQK